MVVAVGGHSRNIGKTSVAAAIIRAIPDARWTAIKITQYGHGVCSDHGGECGCAHPEHPLAIDEELAPSSTDTGRFVSAGAARAVWIRTRMGDIALAGPDLRRLIAESPNTIIESNSVLNLLVPDLYIAVLDFTQPDMKDSARRFLNRADALAVVGEASAPPWAGVPARWLESRPVFRVDPPLYDSAELADFVRNSAPLAR